METTVSVSAASFIAMIVCRSCSSAVTWLLCPSESMDWKSPLAPVPSLFTIFAATRTPTTSSTAITSAGTTTPVRWNRPRFFFRALRGPAGLAG